MHGSNGIRPILIALALAFTPVVLADGGPGQHHADNATTGAYSAAPGTPQAGAPAGTSGLPPDLPRGAPQQQGIGNMSDVPGSMNQGAPQESSGMNDRGVNAPAGTESLPPMLPRDGQQRNGRIGNIEDATGSMQGSGTAPQ